MERVLLATLFKAWKRGEIEYPVCNARNMEVMMKLAVALGYSTL